jgi:hypothetical protein
MSRATTDAPSLQRARVRMRWLCALRPAWSAAPGLLGAPPGPPCGGWPPAIRRRTSTRSTSWRWPARPSRPPQGQLRIEVHPKNSLFALNAIRAAVQDGKAEAGEAIMSSLVADVPIAGADSVPFITAQLRRRACGCGASSAR